MPKRTNPFGDSSPLQFKTHVGKKEVDLGVSRDENMKEVYEKTKEMLFKGAQKQYEVDANSNQIGWQLEMETDSLGCEPLPGQMCLDKHGQLITASSCNQNMVTDAGMPSTSANIPSDFQFSNAKVSTNSCCHCKKVLNKLSSCRCYFCDKQLCQPCTCNCSGCNEHFCQMCSMLNYDESFERAFCFNCMAC